MKYIKRLLKILEDNNISVGDYGLTDETGCFEFGFGGAPYQIEYQPERGKWVALIHEIGRSIFSVEGEYDNAREACIEFLKMSDEDFHLASHIPEFAA